jgi:hypothetical protein
MASAGDAAGLFDRDASAAPGSPKMSGKTNFRRTKLYSYDSVACQVFNPYGKSKITELSTRDVWKAAAAGNKKCAFHSELAADAQNDLWRVGIGISRTAEAVLAGIDQLRDDNLQRLLRPEFLKKASDEAERLKPALEILNTGKGIEKEISNGSFSSLKKQKVSDASSAAKKTIAEKDISDAAEQLFEWLSQDSGPLRAVLSILAGNGTFFAAHVAEKTARSWVQHKPALKTDVVAAALKRGSASGKEEESAQATKDTAGLFP